MSVMHWSFRSRPWAGPGTDAESPDDTNLCAGLERAAAPEKVSSTDALVSMVDGVSAEVAASMRTYPVSRALNNVRTADPADLAIIREV
ncbi:hypothetical protein [Sanguibacter sp. 25GB23B1]|uniref:hypothetical protein n=1 Tax=unclassified Sanguibacter TaxID=2645534 RepID=UPI0032AEB2EF